MNSNTGTFIRYYRASITLTGGQQGIWYGEYDRSFSVREFVMSPDSRTTVAPFDMMFHETRHPTEPPSIAGIEPMAWRAFESLWAEFAHARLDDLALHDGDIVAYADIGYFRMPFPLN